MESPVSNRKVYGCWRAVMVASPKCLFFILPLMLRALMGDAKGRHNKMWSGPNCVNFWMQFFFFFFSRKMDELNTRLVN